jgi:tRNA nucleotidyltransferase/poly(A) polymerase
MKLSELLLAIEKIADDRGLSRPFIVGGLARDKLLKRVKDINDVDITTGDDTIHYLSRHIGNTITGPNVTFNVMDDGHARIKIGGFKLDFSSNFIMPGIDKILAQAGINNPTEMLRELYSRDFTCNTALMDMGISKITDPTGLAIEDINDKVIKTCLNPALTLGYDNKRIVRALYLAGKLGFDVDSKTKEWIRRNPHLIANVSPDYVAKKILKGMKYNPDIVVSLIKELGLAPYLPLIPELAPHLS